MKVRIKSTQDLPQQEAQDSESLGVCCATTKAQQDL